jgi:aromatic ring hydroxylase
MGARTGAEYLQRLRSVPREVWLDGRRVDDVTEEPANPRRSPRTRRCGTASLCVPARR